MTDGNAPVARGYPGSATHPAQMSNLELAHALDNYRNWTFLQPQTKDLLNAAAQRLRGLAQSPTVREALELAYRELKKHDADYHHRTSIEINNKIVDALSSAELLNDRLDIAQRIIAEYRAGTTAGAKADVAAHGLPGARGEGSVNCGEEAIREAAESAAVGAQIIRSEGDLLVYYSGFNLSRFVRYLALSISSTQEKSP